MIEKLTFGTFSKEDAKNFMRLMIYVKPYKTRIFLALLAIVGVALTESYLAAFIAPLVNQGFAAPTTAPPVQEMSGLVSSLKHYKDQFQYMIWGTADKIWIVPIFFIVYGQYSL